MSPALINHDIRPGIRLGARITKVSGISERHGTRFGDRARFLLLAGPIVFESMNEDQHLSGLMSMTLKSLHLVSPSFS